MLQHGGRRISEIYVLILFCTFCLWKGVETTTSSWYLTNANAQLNCAIEVTELLNNAPSIGDPANTGVPGYTLQQVLIDNQDNLYIQTSTIVWSYSPDLTVRWTTPLSSNSYSEPFMGLSVVSNKLYVLIYDDPFARLVALSSETGELEWEYTISLEYADFNGGGTIDSDGNVYIMVGDVIVSLTSEGVVRWETTYTPLQSTLRRVLVLSVGEEIVYLQDVGQHDFSQRDIYGFVLISLYAKNGTTIWTKTNEELGTGVVYAPLDLVFTPTSGSGEFLVLSESYSFFVIDVQNVRLVYASSHLPSQNGVIWEIGSTQSGDILIVACSYEIIAVHATNFSVIWEQPTPNQNNVYSMNLGNAVQGIAVVNDELLYYLITIGYKEYYDGNSISVNAMVCLDIGSGSSQWSIEPNDDFLYGNMAVSGTGTVALTSHELIVDRVVEDTVGVYLISSNWSGIFSWEEYLLENIFIVIGIFCIVLFLVCLCVWLISPRQSVCDYMSGYLVKSNEVVEVCRQITGNEDDRLVCVCCLCTEVQLRYRIDAIFVFCFGLLVELATTIVLTIYVNPNCDTSEIVTTRHVNCNPDPLVSGLFNSIFAAVLSLPVVGFGTALLSFSHSLRQVVCYLIFFLLSGAICYFLYLFVDVIRTILLTWIFSVFLGFFVNPAVKYSLFCGFCRSIIKYNKNS